MTLRALKQVNSEYAQVVANDEVDEFAETVLRSVQGLSLDLADIAGNVDTVLHRVSSQTDYLVELTTLAQQLSVAAREIDIAGSVATKQAAQVQEGNKDSEATVNDATSRISLLVRDVSVIEEQLRSLNDSLSDVGNVSAEIQNVARLTNLLALNAKIEATHAGDAGKGFAVVAGEVKTLASKTGSAAGVIDSTIRDVSSNVDLLIRSGGEARVVADRVSDGVTVINKTVTSFGDMASSMQMSIDRIASAATQSLNQSEGMQKKIEKAAVDMQDAHHALKQADTKIHSLLGVSESLVELVVADGRKVRDRKIIDSVIDTANALSSLFKQAVANGEISISELFDENYKPIENSDPQQFITKFVVFTDRVVSPILESLLEIDDNIVFCAAVDRNGYLPTHNLKFSSPQRANDPGWNNANCRNRRIFNDRTGLACAQNQKHFLMQTYRRDMGNGQHVLMYDCSSPIWVDGQHWGGFRVGYKAQKNG